MNTKYRHVVADYYISTDETNITLYLKNITESGDNKGKAYYYPQGYYSNYKRLYEKLCELGFKEFIPNDFITCVNFCDEAKKSVKDFIVKEKNKRFLSVA